MQPATIRAWLLDTRSSLNDHTGLSCDVTGKLDASPRWRACRPGFLLPVRVLSRVFRGKLLAGLRAIFDQGQLHLPGALHKSAEPDGRAAWWQTLYEQDWVVYSKRPFGGPAQVLKYLARYTHRVAISNARLVELRNGRVTFRYRDYADGRREKTMTLDAHEFLRRFTTPGPWRRTATTCSPGSLSVCPRVAPAQPRLRP